MRSWLITIGIITGFIGTAVLIAISDIVKWIFVFAMVWAVIYMIKSEVDEYLIRRDVDKSLDKYNEKVN